MENKNNQFELLCKLASDENWCWDLYCTTCGHTHFRYAFVQLALHTKVNDKGRISVQKDGSYKVSGWIVKSNRQDYSDYLGDMPWEYDQTQKDVISETCSDADLSIIASNCSHPAWLGYLGLVVHYMQSDSDFYKKLSRSWASQLIRMSSDCRFALDDVKQGKSLMDLKDIQRCEYSVLDNKKSSG